MIFFFFLIRFFLYFIDFLFHGFSSFPYSSSSLSTVILNISLNTIFFLIFLIPFFALNTNLAYAIFSGILSFVVLLILSIIKILPKFRVRLKKVVNISSKYNYDDESPLEKIIDDLFLNFSITIIHIIINTVLSFLSTFSLLYLVREYYLSTIYKLLAALILGMAHKSLFAPNVREFYATCIYDFENSQTRCFSIILLSVFLFFLKKYNIDYLYIQSFLFVLLFFMAFDITIVYGLIGLPRTSFHWFIEFFNRYAFGFSGCTTISNSLLQFIRGAISVVSSSAILYFKNTFWTRAICLFYTYLINFSEPSLKILLFLLIQSLVSAAIFILFNYFCTKKIVINIIEILFIIYFIIFEFVIPTISSISCYLIFYVQLIKSNKVIKFVRMFITFISAPIIIGCLLSDEVHFAISSLLIVHLPNRCFSEPHVFTLALFIARFTLYYDFDLTSNLALNFLISLLISRKFFSIVHLLYLRNKVSMDFLNFDYIDLLKNFPVQIQIIFCYLKTLVINPTNCGLIPAFLWSLITGSPINFIQLNYSLAQPSPPRSNIFWDHPKEKLTVEEHPVETFVYFSYLDSFRKELFNLIKSGNLGIVDENSFFLFRQMDYIILCHLISINTYSVSFQIRCAEFTRTTLCHEGEVRNLVIIGDDDFYRKIYFENAKKYINSIFSPVTTSAYLSGFSSHRINADVAFLSLSINEKKKWISYAVCFYCIENLSEIEIPDLFENNPISNQRELSNYINNQSSNFNEEEEDSDYKLNAKNYVLKDTNFMLDEEIFDLFFDKHSEKYFNFLNTVFKEVFKKIHDPLFFFQVNKKFECHMLTDNEDFLELFDHFCKNAGMKACIYLFLASSYLAPKLKDQDGVMDFLKQTEKEYIPLRHSSNEWYDLLSQFRERFSSKNKNDDEGIFDRSYVTVTSSRNENEEDNNFFNFLKKSQKNWYVYRLHREYVRSIWASQCFDVIGMNNNKNERYSLQYDKFHLHNLLNQISDLPVSYPAYVSDIEKSFFVL